MEQSVNEMDLMDIDSDQCFLAQIYQTIITSQRFVDHLECSKLIQSYLGRVEYSEDLLREVFKWVESPYERVRLTISHVLFEIISNRIVVHVELGKLANDTVPILLMDYSYEIRRFLLGKLVLQSDLERPSLIPMISKTLVQFDTDHRSDNLFNRCFGRIYTWMNSLDSTENQLISDLFGLDDVLFKVYKKKEYKGRVSYIINRIYSFIPRIKSLPSDHQFNSHGSGKQMIEESTLKLRKIVFEMNDITDPMRDWLNINNGFWKSGFIELLKEYHGGVPNLKGKTIYQSIHLFFDFMVLNKDEDFEQLVKFNIKMLSDFLVRVQNYSWFVKYFDYFDQEFINQMILKAFNTYGKKRMGVKEIIKLFNQKKSAFPYDLVSKGSDFFDSTRTEQVIALLAEDQLYDKEQVLGRMKFHNIQVFKNIMGFDMPKERLIRYVQVFLRHSRMVFPTEDENVIHSQFISIHDTIINRELVNDKAFLKSIFYKLIDRHIGYVSNKIKCDKNTWVRLFSVFEKFSSYLVDAEENERVFRSMKEKLMIQLKETYEVNAFKSTLLAILSTPLAGQKALLHHFKEIYAVGFGMLGPEKDTSHSRYHIMKSVLVHHELQVLQILENEKLLDFFFSEPFTYKETSKLLTFKSRLEELTTKMMGIKSNKIEDESLPYFLSKISEPEVKLLAIVKKNPSCYWKMEEFLKLHKGIGPKAVDVNPVLDIFWEGFFRELFHSPNRYSTISKIETLLMHSVDFKTSFITSHLDRIITMQLGLRTLKMVQRILGDAVLMASSLFRSFYSITNSHEIVQRLPVLSGNCVSQLPEYFLKTIIKYSVRKGIILRLALVSKKFFEIVKTLVNNEFLDFEVVKQPMFGKWCLLNRLPKNLVLSHYNPFSPDTLETIEDMDEAIDYSNTEATTVHSPKDVSPKMENIRILTISTVTNNSYSQREFNRLEELILNISHTFPEKNMGWIETSTTLKKFTGIVNNPQIEHSFLEILVEFFTKKTSVETLKFSGYLPSKVNPSIGSDLVLKYYSHELFYCVDVNYTCDPLIIANQFSKLMIQLEAKRRPFTGSDFNFLCRFIKNSTTLRSITANVNELTFVSLIKVLKASLPHNHSLQSIRIAVRPSDISNMVSFDDEVQSILYICSHRPRINNLKLISFTDVSLISQPSTLNLHSFIPHNSQLSSFYRI